MRLLNPTSFAKATGKFLRSFFQKRPAGGHFGLNSDPPFHTDSITKEYLTTINRPKNTYSKWAIRTHKR
jgi:hypothetical protein